MHFPKFCPHPQRTLGPAFTNEHWWPRKVYVEAGGNAGLIAAAAEDEPHDMATRTGHPNSVPHGW
jgi:hypothetical protein